MSDLEGANKGNGDDTVTPTDAQPAGIPEYTPTQFEELTNLVRRLPHDPAISDREYLRVITSIRRAAGAENEAAAQVLAHEWAVRGKKTVTPSGWILDWNDADNDESLDVLGLEYLKEIVRDAAYENPTDIDKLNKRFALVRQPVGILSTPPSGKVRMYSLRDWKTLTHHEYTKDSNGKTVRLNEAWHSSPQHRTYNELVFDPAKPARSGVSSPDGGESFNLWPGLALEPNAKAKCDLFLAHLRDVVASGDETAYTWVEQWLAHIVQRPDKKSDTALVLRGPQGAGKDTVGLVMARILGRELHTTLADPRDLVGRFNSHHEGKILLQVEEAFFAGDPRNVGRIKNLITAEKNRIERKGVESYEIDNYARLFITSNEKWVVPAGLGERRMCVLDVSPSRKNDHAYFTALRSQMLDNNGSAAFLHHLLGVDIDWKFISRPLNNAALRDQQTESLDPARRWLLDLLHDGALPGDGKGEGLALVEDVYASFRLAGVRHASKEQLGRFLAEYGVERTRIRSHGLRVYAYQFPPLAVIQEQFANDLATPPNWNGTRSWSPQDEFMVGEA